MSPWLLLPVAAFALGLIVEFRRYRRVLNQARAELRSDRRVSRAQEAAAAHALAPRTGEVAPAPRLVPLADVVELRAGRMTLKDWEERNGAA